jgi:DNA adenine methylase
MNKQLDRTIIQPSCDTFPVCDGEKKELSVPHPIPYQGSKRKLTARILDLIRGEPVRNLYEPFSGSAAFTLAAAQHNVAGHYYINDSLEPLSEIWNMIIHDPRDLADRYESIWGGHVQDPLKHYYQIRSEFNEDRDPAKLLYLLARCVKNAVRFNDRGEFNQSADKRRLGSKPMRVRREIFGAHAILKGQATSSGLDYTEVLEQTTSADIVYMDPPWQGTSGEKDTRYHQVLDREKLILQLDALNRKSVPFMLSFDGRLGNKTYGDVLPDELQLTRLELNAGRSSQATLAGRNEETFESLYISNNIKRRLERQGKGQLIENHLPLTDKACRSRGAKSAQPAF